MIVKRFFYGTTLKTAFLILANPIAHLFGRRSLGKIKNAKLLL
jgi:hypothetical protein